MTNAWYIFWYVWPVLSSILEVPQTVLDIIGRIINIMTEDTWELRLGYKNIYLDILIVEGIMGSYMIWLVDSVTLIDKADCKNPVQWEHFWQHTLKTLAPHGLNVEDDF